MRMVAATALALLLTACDGGESPEQVSAANRMTMPSGGVVAPDTPSSTGRTDVSEATASVPPFRNSTDPADADAAEAVAVLRRYASALADGRYAEAYRLWGDKGRRSDMDQRAFAASFAKYASYSTDIGAIGAVDAGAGQRYVTMPVRVTGTLRDGRPFILEGPVTLHRTADIDGATAEQRAWRIYASDLAPRPPGGAAAG